MKNPVIIGVLHFRLGSTSWVREASPVGIPQVHPTNQHHGVWVGGRVRPTRDRFGRAAIRGAWTDRDKSTAPCSSSPWSGRGHGGAAGGVLDGHRLRAAVTALRSQQCCDADWGAPNVQSSVYRATSVAGGRGSSATSPRPGCLHSPPPESNRHPLMGTPSTPERAIIIRVSGVRVPPPALAK